MELVSYVTVIFEAFPRQQRQEVVERAVSVRSNQFIVQAPGPCNTCVPCTPSSKSMLLLSPCVP